MYKRLLTSSIETSLLHMPAVAMLGPRQIGKTTLALAIASHRPSIYLDLESPNDLAKLQDPVAYLSTQAGKLVILDEIQRVPELFKTLRGIIDKGRQAGHGNGQFLILGSASLNLLKQSSESLAGRITFLELAGLSPLEISKDKALDPSLWLRGGFPNSFTASSDYLSAQWREDFIRSYLERDIPQLGPRMPAVTLRRFWTMLAHLQGGMINASKLGAGLDISNTTVIRYLDLLVDLLLVRRLEPWHTNTGKRLVRSPKVYIRDSGLLHQLLGIIDFDSLMSHPVMGSSWEGFVIENILTIAPARTDATFYRSVGGAEIDLLLHLPNQELWAIEIKRAFAPTVTRGFYEACQDLQPTRRFVIYNGTEKFPLPHDVEAIGLFEILSLLFELRSIT